LELDQDSLSGSCGVPIVGGEFNGIGYSQAAEQRGDRDLHGGIFLIN
jgi:hypothetical protein